MKKKKVAEAQISRTRVSSGVLFPCLVKLRTVFGVQTTTLPKGYWVPPPT